MKLLFRTFTTFNNRKFGIYCGWSFTQMLSVIDILRRFFSPNVCQAIVSGIDLNLLSSKKSLSLRFHCSAKRCFTSCAVLGNQFVTKSKDSLVDTKGGENGTKTYCPKLTLLTYQSIFSSVGCRS